MSADEIENYINRCSKALERYFKSKSFDPTNWNIVVPTPKNEAEVKGLALWKKEIEIATKAKITIKTDD